MSASTRVSGSSLSLPTTSRYGPSATGASRDTMNGSRPSDCPFCRLPAERVLESNAHALAVADAFPVSPGHTLIILRRHAASFLELTADEVLAVHELLRR